MSTTPLALSPGQLLADLVNRLPGAAQVFESYGLDYCCGGGRSLASACADSQVAVEDVLGSLSELDGQPGADWVAMTPAELVDHLEATHHRYLRDELPRLDALAEKVAGVHGGRHPELAEVLADVAELRDELEPHLLKEERALFPMVRELCSTSGPVQFHCGSLRNPISVMRAEHDRAGELFALLRHHANDFKPPEDACGSYCELYRALAALEADTHLHVHKENNLLFDAVVRMESERIDA